MNYGYLEERKDNELIPGEREDKELSIHGGKEA